MNPALWDTDMVENINSRPQASVVSVFADCHQCIIVIERILPHDSISPVYLGGAVTGVPVGLTQNSEILADPRQATCPLVYQLLPENICC